MKSFVKKEELSGIIASKERNKFIFLISEEGEEISLPKILLEDEYSFTPKVLKSYFDLRDDEDNIFELPFSEESISFCVNFMISEALSSTTEEKLLEEDIPLLSEILKIAFYLDIEDLLLFIENIFFKNIDKKNFMDTISFIQEDVFHF